jgi:hypothetical protein
MLALLFKSLQKCSLGLDYRLTEGDSDNAHPLKVISTRSLLFWSGIDLKKPFSHTALYFITIGAVFLIYMLLAILPCKIFSSLLTISVLSARMEKISNFRANFADINSDRCLLLQQDFNTTFRVGHLKSSSMLRLCP